MYNHILLLIDLFVLNTITIVNSYKENILVFEHLGLFLARNSIFILGRGMSVHNSLPSIERANPN